MPKWWEYTGVGAVIKATGLDDVASDWWYGPKRAAQAQQDAARAGIESTERMFDKSMATQKPWLEAGEQALKSLSGKVARGGFDVDPGQFKYDPYQGKDFQYDKFEGGEFKTPDKFQREEFKGPGEFQFDYKETEGYKNLLEQGIKAVDRGAAAKGSLGSRGTDVDLMKMAQGYAAQDYGAEYNRAYGKYSDKYARDYGQYSDDYARDYGQYSDDYARGYGQFSDKYSRDYGQHVSDRSFDYGQGMDEYNRYAGERGFAYGQFGDEYNRQLQQQGGRYNRLASMAGVGQTAAGNVSSLTMQQGQNLASGYNALGNAQANRAMSTQNQLNPLLNLGAQIGGAFLGGRGGGASKTKVKDRTIAQDVGNA